MLSFVNVRTLSRICTIVALFTLVMAMPASAIALPSVDSVTPSTTNVVNGTDVIIIISGTSEANINDAWIFIQNTQGVITSTGFPVTRNGNQWSGQYTYSIPQSAQSGQYIITRVAVQDSALNYIFKDYHIVINVQNSDQPTPTSTATPTPTPTPTPTIAPTTVLTTVPTTTITTVPTTIITTQLNTVITTIPTNTSTTVPTTSQTTVLTTATTAPVVTTYTTVIPTHSPTTKVTTKSYTTWPTNTPTQRSPLGVEIGIIAMIGVALLVMRRK